MKLRNFLLRTLLISVYSSHSWALENMLNTDKDIEGQQINAHAGGLLYDNGYYYWYGEYRSPKPNDGSHWDSNQKVTLYRSSNMKQWENMGVILDLSHDKRNWDLERPKIIYNDKNHEFIMWFHLEPNRKYTEGFSGVATSNNINGPFKMIYFGRPNANIQSRPQLHGDKNNWFVKKANESYNSFYSKGQQVRDLNLFKDTDNKAYLVYESENDYSLQIVQLTNDYKGFTKNYSRILVGGQNEAPSIFKYGEKYYLISSGLTGYKPNPMRLAVADSLLGPWKSLGSPVLHDEKYTPMIILDSQPSSVFKDPNTNKTILLMDQWDTSNGGFKNLWKSSYIWVPIDFRNGRPTVIY